MIRQETIIINQQVVGNLRIAQWGVVFEPGDQHPMFNKVRLKTWETVEAAKAEIIGELKSGGQQGG